MLSVDPPGNLSARKPGVWSPEVRPLGHGAGGGRERKERASPGGGKGREEDDGGCGSSLVTTPADRRVA